ncbi:hypothetical protein V5O48_009348 [Marasmius crinis-equi]|uniref:Uncharacterized protein n=1 Tax=Marasmius crinis-equi TaxID=585013 RepID=A0ABR3FBG8_9AGAR
MSSNSSSIYPESATSEEISKKPTRARASARKRKAQPSDCTAGYDTIVNGSAKCKEQSPPPPSPPKEKVVSWINTLPLCSGDYVSASIPPTPRLGTRALELSSSSSSSPRSRTLPLPHSQPPPSHLPSSCSAAGVEDKECRSLSAPHIQGRINEPPASRYAHDLQCLPNEDDRSSAPSQRGVYRKQPRCDWALERYMQSFVGHYIVCAGCGQIVQEKDFENLHDYYCPDNM